MLDGHVGAHMCPWCCLQVSDFGLSRTTANESAMSTNTFGAPPRGARQLWRAALNLWRLPAACVEADAA